MASAYPDMDYKTFAEDMSASYDEVLGRKWSTNDIELIVSKVKSPNLLRTIWTCDCNVSSTKVAS